MISSGVVPAGGVLSRGPSWARAGIAASPQTSRVKESSKRTGTDFILYSLTCPVRALRGGFVEASLATSVAAAWRGAACVTYKDAASREQTQQTAPLRELTAATRPSNPSPLSEAGGKGAAVLPLTWMPK